MKSRREFLKEAATGAMLLGSSAAAEKLALAEVLTHNGSRATQKSKVVIARDASLHGANTQPDEQHVLNLLDKAMAAYTGRHHPVEAWKSIIPADILAGKVIGLKVNGVGGRGVSTHTALILAVAERLQQAGVKPGNILVWEQGAHQLENCGMTANTDPSRMRCYSNEHAGYEDEPVLCGPVRIRLAKILTQECAMVINLPVVKNHDIAVSTFSLKNMYGAVQRPVDLHVNKCATGVADLNCLPVVRGKMRFTIGDAMSAVYEGGPVFHPEWLWHPNALMVGKDPVALDYLAWQMIERKRAEVGMPPLESTGRSSKYLAIAADAAHRLGTCDPRRINLIEA